MEPTLTRGATQPDMDQIAAIFAAEGLEPQTWSNGPHDTYGTHSHSYHKVLFCLSGSITFIVGSLQLKMVPGDRLDLPPATPHSAIVGEHGVVCMEAPKFA